MNWTAITIYENINNCTCFMMIGKRTQEFISDWDYVQKQLWEIVIEKFISQKLIKKLINKSIKKLTKNLTWAWTEQL